MQQQSFDYIANQGSGLTNLGIPLQSQTPASMTASPYMQIPQNSSIVRDNGMGYPIYPPNNIQRQLPQSYPQNPLAQSPQNTMMPNQMVSPQQQQQMNYMMNQNRMGMYQAQQINHQNVYQKPPQMMQQQSIPMEMQNGYPYQQSPYQRVTYMPPQDMHFEGSPQSQQQQQLPLNPMNPLSQLHQNLYLSPPQMKQMAPKKVSFGPDTKGNDGSNSPAPSSTDSNNNNQTSNQALPTSTSTQVIPTKIAFNNNAIVKSSSKSTVCNLCRKQHTIGTSLYCTNCDNYLSRFNVRR